MDLWLWDATDDQGYLTSYESNCSPGYVEQRCHCFGHGPDQSGCYDQGYFQGGFCFDCGRDVIEENAMNEKSCIQVLKIWMDKADEDIIKLEEDIVMLQCPLAWDNEALSASWSAVLREKIDHLDKLIQSLKKENAEYMHVENPVELPQSLHDLLKPLVENTPAKSKQIESSLTQKPALSAVGPGMNKSEASTSKGAIMLKTNQLRSQGVKLEERRLNDPLHVDYTNQRTESSGKAQKATAYRHSINKNALSTNPSVDMKRRLTDSPETTEASEAKETKRTCSVGAFNDRTKHATNPDGQGTQMKCNADPKEVQNSFVADNIYTGSSEAAVPSNSSLQKGGSDGMDRLTVKHLKAIAKNRGMRGYTNLSKAELQKRLGLEQLHSGATSV